MQPLNQTKTISEYRRAGGDPYSSNNQRIRDTLVSRNIKCCASTMIYDLARLDHFMGDEDLMALLTRYDYETPCRDDGWQLFSEMPTQAIKDQAVEDYGCEPVYVKLDELEVVDTSGEDSWQELCNDNSLDADTDEVYEHWIVDSWFMEILAAHGETTGEFLGLNIWGRCTTGQSISMDEIIGDIAAEMQILDGQKYSWAEDK